MKLWLLRGGWLPDLGWNRAFFYVTMRIEGVQTSGLVATSLGFIVLTGIEEVVAAIVTLIVLAGKQKVVMRVWV